MLFVANVAQSPKPVPSNSPPACNPLALFNAFVVASVAPSPTPVDLGKGVKLEREKEEEKPGWGGVVR